MPQISTLLVFLHYYDNFCETQQKKVLHTWNELNWVNTGCIWLSFKHNSLLWNITLLEQGDSKTNKKAEEEIEC